VSTFSIAALLASTILANAGNGEAFQIGPYNGCTYLLTKMVAPGNMCSLARGGSRAVGFWGPTNCQP
jgi:hypothetical protein